MIYDHASLLALDAREWHTYKIEHQADRVLYWVDGQLCSETPVSPTGRLGVVIWIDNQFAAFPPDGRLRFGNLANPQEAWLEFKAFSVRFPTR
jgi:hypothetical protein